MIKSNLKHNVSGSGKVNVLSDLQKQKEMILRDMEEQKRRKQREIEKKQVKNIPVAASNIIEKKPKEITPPIVRKPIRVESKSFAEIMREAEQRSKHKDYDVSDNNKTNVNKESSLPSIKRKISDITRDKESIIPNKKVKLNDNVNNLVGLKTKPISINSIPKQNSLSQSSINNRNGNINNKSHDYHKKVDKTIYENNRESSKGIKPGILAQSSSRNVNNQSSAGPISKNNKNISSSNQNSSKNMDSNRINSINSKNHSNSTKQNQERSNGIMKNQSINNINRPKVKLQPTSETMINGKSSVSNGSSLNNRTLNRSSREKTVQNNANINEKPQKSSNSCPSVKSNQNAARGIAAQSAHRGVAPQSTSKGIAAQSASRRGTAQNAPKGIAAQSASRGIAAQSAPRGIAAQSAPRGIAAQSAPRGIAAQSAPRGIAAQSAPRGIAAQSAPRGIAAQSAPRGIAAQSAPRGIAAQSAARGILAQSGTNDNYRSDSEYEDEYDSELDNFIDDTDDFVDDSIKKEIYKSLNYDPNKYAKVSKYDDCRNMVSRFDEICKEEIRSSKIGRHEDLLELKELEKASEKKMKSKHY